MTYKITDLWSTCRKINRGISMFSLKYHDLTLI